MTCKQCEMQLNALADGALPPLRAWPIRRHLAQCPACAKAYAEIVQMGSEARAWRTAAPPAALAVRITLALPPQTTRRENAAMILERPQPVAVPPRRIAARKARIALALAACLAIVLAVTLWPSKQASLPAAYADTVLAMQRVRSVAWTQTVTNDNPDGSQGIHQVEQTWVRRDPPAIATLAPPDPSTHGISGGYRTLKDAHGSRRTKLNGGETQLRPLRTPIAEQVQDTLADLTSFSALSSSPLTSSGVVLATTQTPWIQEQVVLNGHTLLRFRKELTAVFPTLPGEAVQGRTVTHLALWVDPLTHRVLRTEWQFVGSKIGRLDSVQDRFVYDRPAPAGVFDEAAYSAASPQGKASAATPSQPPPPAALENMSSQSAPETAATQLRTVTVIGVYLPHSPLLPPRWRREYLEPSTNVLIVSQDFHPNHAYHEWLFLQHGASKNFVMKSPGRADVPLTLDGVTYGGRNAPNTQGFGARLTPQARAMLVPGAAYTLHPINTNAVYQWAVAPNVTLRIP